MNTTMINAMLMQYKEDIFLELKEGASHHLTMYASINELLNHIVDNLREWQLPIIEEALSVTRDTVDILADVFKVYLSRAHDPVGGDPLHAKEEINEWLSRIILVKLEEFTHKLLG